MTVEEAIKWLEYSKQGEIGKAVEAADMAIKALSQQTEYHGTEDMEGLYYCPICQQTTTVVKDGKCPKCGATMDELSTRAQQTEDAISREAAKQAIRERFKELVDRVEINSVLNELPTVEPSRPTGHWIFNGGIEPIGWYCSNCGLWSSAVYKPNYKYCPNCGFRMIEPQENEVEQ